MGDCAIAGLAACPVDGYGVGTSLVTGSGHPTCGFVYKLVAREDDERVVSEDPPGGGPVAGIAAGFACLTTGPYAAELGPSAPDVVVVLAGDLPLLTREHLEALVSAVDDRVAVTRSSSGPNWLCSAWPSALLRLRLAAVGGPAGVSVRRLLGQVPRIEVPDVADVAVDVDTPAELEAARRRADES